jgi:hypothetical protein
MRGIICGVLALAAVASLSLPAVGQIVKLPYTAEYKEHHVIPLHLGNAVNDSTKVVAVDSQGRTMTSSTQVSNIVPLRDGKTIELIKSASEPFIKVTDPVARTIISWALSLKKVTLREMPALAVPDNCQDQTAKIAGSSAPSSETHAPTSPLSSKDLGTKIINGFEAHGTLITITKPADADGNSEPRVSTIEVWKSTTPGLEKLIVYEVTDDPKTGGVTNELVKLSQAEPDPTLFQPPSDFIVVHEKARQLPHHCPQ